MWYKSEAVGTKPANVDTVSSKTTVYVRKNFVRTEDEDGAVKWNYLEQKVPKDDWQVYTQIIDLNQTVSDLNDAVMELADIIGG